MIRKLPPERVLSTLHLVIPGLLEPGEARGQPPFPQPRAPALERLLARAHGTTVGVEGPDATLFRLFGVPVRADRDLPVAAVTRLADGGDPADEGWWLRADPVHLRADLHQVLLFDVRGPELTAEEARALVGECNRLLADDGWRLQAPHPCRWYLRLENDPGLRTEPLTEVVGRDLNSRLPRGESARRWTALLTEIQMLFHATPLNRERESRGQPPINGIWLWGGGRLPREARVPADAIYAGDPLTCGLARLAGAPAGPPPAGAAEWRAAAGGAAQSLVVLETAHYDRIENGPCAWAEHVSALDAAWFAPCLDLLKGGALQGLRLYPCDGRCYELVARRLRQFWRRSRPLSYYLR